MSSKPNRQASKTAHKSFREVPVSQRSIWESWAVLPAKTRLKVSLGIVGFSVAGLVVSNLLERTLPPPTAEHTTTANTTPS